MAVGNEKLLVLENCKNIIISGLDFSNTRKNAVELNKCENISFENNTIKQIRSTALTFSGKNISISNNKIFSIGGIGIDLKNAINKNNLEKDNNVIESNNINNFGQILRSYAPAINLNGVGNIARNNIIHTSPHTAIMYGGNYNIIEKNEIYDVCLNAGDAGAIYSGRSFSFYGNEIRYNYIHDIGSGSFKPNAIYLDDFLSGQRVYSNVFANIPGRGVLCGGGRDNFIENNIFLNTTLSFDERAYRYYVNSNKDYTDIDNGSFWKLIASAQKLNNLWNGEFESITKMTNDKTLFNTAEFAVNPANNNISNNYFTLKSTTYMVITNRVKTFSKIENNIYCPSESSSFDKTKTYDKEYIKSFINELFETTSTLSPFTI